MQLQFPEYFNHKNNKWHQQTKNEPEIQELQVCSGW